MREGQRSDGRGGTRPYQIGKDDFHIVPDQSPSGAAGKDNKWDGVEPIPTKRGKDDFYVVPD